MFDIGIRYYTDNPKPDQNVSSDNEDTKRCIGIMDLNIRTPFLEDDIINIVDKKKYLESSSLSLHLRSKDDCDRVITLIQKMKNNLQY